MLAALLISMSANAADDTQPGFLLPELEYNPALVCPDGSPGACDSEDILNAVEFGADYAAVIETRCLYRTQAPCRPISAGRIFGARRGDPLIWQYMELSPSDGPVTRMLVIAEGGAAPDPYVLAARQTVGWFAPPMLVENGTEGMIIHAPGRGGAGLSGRSDLVLSRHEAGWTTFSVPDLLDEAQGLMPPGFKLAPSAEVDLSAMLLTVAVYHTDDDACCPSGGMAQIKLDMPEANMIRVSRVTFMESRPVHTRHLKPGGNPGREED
jgi:hypothetical protein